MITNVMERLIDFTRTSGGGYFGPDGLFRFTPASRNLLLQTQEFDVSTWSKAAVTVTANTTTAPDGTLTGDALIATAGTAAHNIHQSGGGSGAAITMSIYAKAGTTSFVQLYHGAASTTFANFNLAAGAVGTVGAGATATITSVGNGWYRCTMTFTPGSASTNRVAMISSATAAYNESWTATGTESILIWGAQLELGSTATDYTRNVGGLYPPRFDYDPVTLAPRGLLIEEQRTNLLLRSEELENAAWDMSSVTVTANSAVSPDGIVDADKLVEAAANAAHYVRQIISSGISDNTTFTTSIYVKAAGRTEVRLEGRRKDGTFWGATFDLSAGTLAASSNVVGTPTIEPVGDGWFRISASFNSLAGAGVPTFAVLVVSGGVTTYLGDGTSGIYVWGAQLEAGAFATSYIPTAASQVTRTADAATITGANFSRWYNQSEGTFLVEADSFASVDTVVRWTVSASDSSASLRNTVFLYNGKWGASARISGTDQCDLQQTGSYTPNTAAKIAFAYKANDFAASVNGLAALTDNSGSIPSVDRLFVGSLGVINVLNGHIRRIRYYPTRLSNTQLQALTA